MASNHQLNPIIMKNLLNLFIIIFVLTLCSCGGNVQIGPPQATPVYQQNQNTGPKDYTFVGYILLPVGPAGLNTPVYIDPACTQPVVNLLNGDNVVASFANPDMSIPFQQVKGTAFVNGVGAGIPAAQGPPVFSYKINNVR